MSSILNAFKKLENDKKIIKQEQLRIDENILQDGLSIRFSRTVVLLTAVALFVCGSGATYYYLKNDATKRVEPQTVYSRIESNSQPPLSTDIPAVFKKNTAQPATVTKSLSHKISPPSVTPARLPNTKKIISKPEKQAEIIPASGARSVSKTTQTATTANRPILTVNGIAFQDGGRDNMAMINGISVAAGDMIEGVMVEDIQKTRVVFSQGGEKFNINLNKSNKQPD